MLWPPLRLARAHPDAGLGGLPTSASGFSVGDLQVPSLLPPQLQPQHIIVIWVFGQLEGPWNDLEPLLSARAPAPGRFGEQYLPDALRATTLPVTILRGSLPASSNSWGQEFISGGGICTWLWDHNPGSPALLGTSEEITRFLFISLLFLTSQRKMAFPSVCLSLALGRTHISLGPNSRGQGLGACTQLPEGSGPVFGE